MDTGSYMENQMSDLIDNSEIIHEQFNKWLYNVCRLKGNAHEIYPTINLTDAKLSYLEGASEIEYSKLT